MIVGDDYTSREIQRINDHFNTKKAKDKLEKITPKKKRKPCRVSKFKETCCVCGKKRITNHSKENYRFTCSSICEEAIIIASKEVFKKTGYTNGRKKQKIMEEAKNKDTIIAEYVGREDEFDDKETREEFLVLLSKDVPADEACIFMGLSEDVFLYKYEHDKEFKKEVEQAKKRIFVKAKVNIANSIEMGDEKMSLNFLERRQKKRYSKRKEISNNTDSREVRNTLDRIEKAFNNKITSSEAQKLN